MAHAWVDIARERLFTIRCIMGANTCHGGDGEARAAATRFRERERISQASKARRQRSRLGNQSYRAACRPGGRAEAYGGIAVNHSSMSPGTRERLMDLLVGSRPPPCRARMKRIALSRPAVSAEAAGELAAAGLNPSPEAAFRSFCAEAAAETAEKRIRG